MLHAWNRVDAPASCPIGARPALACPKAATPFPSDWQQPQRPCCSASFTCAQVAAAVNGHVRHVLTSYTALCPLQVIPVTSAARTMLPRSPSTLQQGQQWSWTRSCLRTGLNADVSCQCSSHEQQLTCQGSTSSRRHTYMQLAHAYHAVCHGAYPQQVIVRMPTASAACMLTLPFPLLSLPFHRCSCAWMLWPCTASPATMPLEGTPPFQVPPLGSPTCCALSWACCSV